MPRLFIPEIGTTLTLSKDWTFNLHAESRNKGLLEMCGCSVAFDSIDRRFFLYHSKHKMPLCPPLYFHGITSPVSDEEQTKIDSSNKRRDKFLIERKEWEEKIASNKKYSISVTLKKGINLKVDRIYIRKGASDFNSVSFFTAIEGKKYRFWAKLDEVNNINFV